VHQGAKECQLTVHYQKLEKLGRKHQKLRLHQKQRQAQKLEVDAIMKSVLF
jgi:hypothetical protein